MQKIAEMKNIPYFLPGVYICTNVAIVTTDLGSLWCKNNMHTLKLILPTVKSLI